MAQIVAMATRTVYHHPTSSNPRRGLMNAFTIYEKHPTADAYRVGGFYSPYALVSADKRFTDAELAAEYWASDRMYEQEKWTDSSARVEVDRQTYILYRFAFFPHFDA